MDKKTVLERIESGKLTYRQALKVNFNLLSIKQLIALQEHFFANGAQIWIAVCKKININKFPVRGIFEISQAIRHCDNPKKASPVFIQKLDFDRLTNPDIIRLGDIHSSAGWREIVKKIDFAKFTDKQLAQVICGVDKDLATLEIVVSRLRKK